MNTIRRTFFVILLLLLTPLPLLSSDLPSRETLRQWIAEMKTSSRGPFARIRWFCKDGSILPPKAYACEDHDGGVQHGEWTDRVKRLRAGGYYIANILASTEVSRITNTPGYSDLYNQILIEKFLIAADDGWIFRKARYYRGAVQAEDEAAMARELLLGLAAQDGWNLRGFIPLRIGANLLDHGVETMPIRLTQVDTLTGDSGQWWVSTVC